MTRPHLKSCVAPCLVAAAVIAFFGCSRTKPPVQTPPTPMPAGVQNRDFDVAALVDIWHAARSDTYGDWAFGSSLHAETDDGLDGWELLQAVGLVAEYRLATRAGGVDAVVETLEDFEFHPGNGHHDEGFVLLDLLPRLGDRGLKAAVGFVLGEPAEPEAGTMNLRIGGPSLDADDAEWVAATREWAELHPATELLWRFGRDEAALTAMVEDLEIWMNPDYWEEGMSTPDEIARTILVCAPVDGGATNEQLLEWRSEGIDGITWACDLALASRGDDEARQRLTGTIRMGFPPGEPPTELGAWRRNYRPHAACVILAELVRDEALEDRWPLLADAIELDDETLIGPRAVCMALADDHWTEIPADDQERLRHAGQAALETSSSAWLRARAMEFLAQHAVSPYR